MLKLTIPIIFGFFAIYGSTKRYDRYQVLEIVPKTKQALQALLEFQKSHENVDFWRPPSKLGKSVHLMVKPEHEAMLVKQFLEKSADMDFKTIIWDVQGLIDMENQIDLNKEVEFGNATANGLQIDKYHSHTEINKWLDYLANHYPSVASTFSIGKSHEGRDMKVIKIGTPGMNKKGFWLDAGIHAREWVAPATALYIVNELVTKYNSNSDYKKLVDSIDFYILPSANPDGYEYSRNFKRLWRKTRGGPYCKKNWFGGKKCCRGADPNRNWDFHWRDAASGSSMDWARGVANIDLSFILELRPGHSDPDNDQVYGFLLPPKYIIPTASEAWAGIKVVAESLIT